MIEFDIAWPVVIGTIVSVILPLLVGLVTKRMTDSGVKAGLLALLATAVGVLTEFGNALVNDQPFNIAMALFMVVIAFITGVGMHYGLFKPTGVSAKLQAVGDHSE